MTFDQWVTVGSIAGGVLSTWAVGAFTLGRAVEKMKADFKAMLDGERDRIVNKIDAMEEKFLADQRTQDHNFGEVGAAMRQYIADVEKKVREVEIYGRDNYVKIPDFEKALDRVGETVASAIKELKDDMRAILKQP